jgi:hypothetical protein
VGKGKVTFLLFAGDHISVAEIDQLGAGYEGRGARSVKLTIHLHPVKFPFNPSGSPIGFMT